MVKTSKALSDVQPELEKLLHKAVAKAAISTRRLNRYLSCYDSEAKLDISTTFDCDKHFNGKETDVAAHDASCTLSSNNEQEFDLVLENVNLLVPKGSMVALIGEDNKLVNV